MPGQVVDVDSLLLNTSGVALAHLLIVPLSRSRLRRGNRAGAGDLSRIGARSVRAEGPQGSTPTITRVGIAP